jgi:hypothetical protein
MRGVIGRTAVDPIKQHFGALLSQPRVLSGELRLLGVQGCEAPTFLSKSACAESVD